MGKLYKIWESANADFLPAVGDIADHRYALALIRLRVELCLGLGPDTPTLLFTFKAYSSRLVMSVASNRAS